MIHLQPTRFVSFVGVLSGLLVASAAQAQQGRTPPEVPLDAQLETWARLVEFGFSVFFLLVLGAVLLIARRNMQGWNQPLMWVWFSFSGRLNRKAYWLKGVLLLSVVGLVVQLFSLLVGALFTGGSDVAGVLGGLAVLIVLLPMVVLNTWVSLAISVKRAHDLGHSGWWLLLFLIPIYNIWMAIVLAFFRGTPGPNDYGDDPIDPLKDALDELFGGDDGEDDAPPVVRPKPSPPSTGGDDAPKGFGSRPFERPLAPVAAGAEEVFVPMTSPDVSPSLDVIKRRLGDDILRPIQRKGGGGRDPEG